VVVQTVHQVKQVVLMAVLEVTGKVCGLQEGEQGILEVLGLMVQLLVLMVMEDY
jgi:hypothetical protein